MGFIKQTWTLTVKNLMIVWLRHPVATTLRAFVLPIVFMFFISYAKNFFVPPAQFGIGSPTPVRSFDDALRASSASQSTVAFLNNGLTGGDIDRVIENLSGQVRAAGKTPQVVGPDELLTVCRSSLRGVTRCYGAATFYSSPTEGEGGIWNYTISADGSLGQKIYVDRDDNDSEIYTIPFQHAIDDAILSVNATSLPATIEEYPFTQESQEERARKITQLYQGTVISILALAFFVGIVGVAYQLVGHMASERELGMSQLIEAMMPNARRWEPQVARIIANHLAFDIIYLPGWLIMGFIVKYLVFPQTSNGIVVVTHLLIGFALTSCSIFVASFFRKAQLSGITATLAFVVLSIIAQVAVTDSGSSGAVIVTSLLFPPMTYTFLLIFMAKFQQNTQAANLAQSPPDSPWNFPGIVFWILFIIQMLLFPILGALVERWLYGTASKTRKVLQDSGETKQSLATISLKGFSKHFGPGWLKRNLLKCGRRPKKENVVAVDNLSLDILRGQIAVLLGANGSGKSTTLDAIAGLSKPTSGTIEVDGTGGLGLCPQKNVLWDELNVYEHVRIFDRLKSADGRKATKAEIEELVKACDLDMKLKSQSCTLSGGQKRKLQLAMMFTGGSRVCCVDEVSSGIDPLARRKVWDILLAERGKRTILLTTHFLDEADVLSDHIAILSKGSLKAEGTSVALKHQLSGYRVSIPLSSQQPTPEQVEGILHHTDYDNEIYQLKDSAAVSKFIDGLEEDNIDYRVQSPTIEEIFLSICDEVREELVHTDGTESTKSPSDSETRSPTPTQRKSLELLTGQGTHLSRQTWILFRKRCLVLTRNYLPYLALVLIPIIAAGLVTLFLQGFDAIGCNPQDQVSAGDLSNLTSQLQPLVVYGPPGVVPEGTLTRFYHNLNATSLHTVDTLDEFNQFIVNNYHNVTPGGFFVPESGNPVFAYVANYDIAFSVLVQNLLNDVLSGSLISTQYQPFAVPFAPGTGDTLQLIFYFGLAMSIYPAFFALYPTAERLRRVRALHFSNGVRSAPLWIAYAAFDFIFVLIASAIVTILFAAAWDGWYHIGYLFIVFFCYGLASIAFSYVVSLFATSQLAAFAFAAGIQAILFLLYFIAYLVIITYAPVESIDHFVSVAHFTIAIITPSGNFLRSMLLTLNIFSLLCRDRSIVSYPGDITVYGGPILYLLVQFFVLMAFLIWYDSGGRITIFRRRRNTAHTKDIEESNTSSPEISEELSRVASSNDGLRVLNMSKAFGNNLAVDDVTFGVRKGETFALLGPNGAGKSTTISLIRGDIRPSNKDGDIFVERVALSKHRVAARNHLGVCPQFDAIDTMTVLGHLRFYARVRGVPDVDHNVNAIMTAVGLTPYAGRLASKLSGGNKRKLSLAIALMGNPAVLLLDEPSSGMDAAAKRVMWRVLGSVTTGRALLITTHSMEEADALAQRAGIIAGRMLALGTTDALRRRHGDAFHVHMVHREAPHTDRDEMDRVKAWVQSNIPGAQTEDRTYHGQLRFSVPNAREAADEKGSGGGVNGMAALFKLLERHREELACAYYSVSPTTLDQVFLNVVRKHNIQGEDARREGSKAKSRPGVHTKAGFLAFFGL